MRDPCEVCMEQDRCVGEQPCRKKEVYEGRYKEMCKKVAEHTKRVMQRTKERMNNESRTQNITTET